MMRKRIVALFLVSVLFVSCALPICAEQQQEVSEVSLSMYSNLSTKSRIDGLCCENAFYVSAEDLCQVVNYNIEQQTHEHVIIHSNEKARRIQIFHKEQALMECDYPEKLIAIPVICYDGNYYYSLLHFLKYLDINVSVQKDGNPQLVIYAQYSVWDALAEYRKF